MNMKGLLSVLLLCVVAIGFSGTASATVCHGYECPYCHVTKNTPDAMNSHLVKCHGVGQDQITIVESNPTPGPKGDTGAAGKDGINGKDGKDGANGKDGVVDYSKVQGMINSATSGIQAQINAINANLSNVWKSINWIIAVNVNQINLIDDLQAQIDNIQLTPGPQGEKGDTGAAGIDGVNGVNGIDGINGVDGLNGVNGIDGAQGIQGVPGLVGAVGEAGVNGVNGLNGLPGEDGVNSGSISLEDKKTGANLLPLVLAILAIAGVLGYVLVRRE